MGLFSSKRTDVASVAISAITDTPNVSGDSIMLSILTDGDITGDLVNNYVNGMGLKMRSMQLYADAHYIYGLPNGEVAAQRATDQRVKLAIESEIAETVKIRSNIAGTVDADSLAHEYLSVNRDWEESDNIVGNPPASTGVVSFVEATIPTIGTLRLTYLDDVGEFTEDVVIAGLKSNDVYYHASYSTLAAPLKILYWNYEVSTNVHPELQTGRTVQANNPYFPIVPFRVNNVNQNDNPASAEAISSQNLLRRIDMDFGELCVSIHESPDIAEVDQAFLYIAVPLMSAEQNSINYLHDHFLDLEKVSQVSKRSYDIWEAREKNTAPPAVNTIHITDSTLNLELSYTYIDSVVSTAVIGDIGESIRSTNVVAPGVQTRTTESERSGETHEVESFTWEQSTVTFTRQINATQIVTTTVHGLYSINHIYGIHTVEASLEEAIADKSVMLIPVNVNVVNAMGIKKGDLLYYDAMWIVINSYKVTKLEWYETALFKLIVQIVAIIITIYSLGSMAELALAAATIGEAAVAVMTQILIKLAVAAAIDFVMQEVGLEAAIILAAAAAIYGVGGGGTQGAEGALLPFAETVLELVQVMVKEIGEDIQDAIGDVQDQMAALLDEQDEIEKEFERLEMELKGNSADIDFLDVIRLRPNIDLTESPSDFYHRAIHSGNIGTASVDAPANYVSTMLELPSNKLF